MASPHLPPPPLLDAGWYPDPTSRYEARYWDGRKWTSHISHYGATGADPLLRARFDYWWVRLLARAVVWGAVVLVGLWAFGKYWPDSDRDLEADRELARAAVTTPVGVPVGWVPDSREPLSPLTLEVGDDDQVDLAGCEPFSGLVADGSDEPRTTVAYADPGGVAAFAQEVVLWADEDAAQEHLGDLRRDEIGACLSALWVAALAVDGRTLDVTAVEPQVDPSYGEGAVWWRVTGQSREGLPVELFADVIAVRTGRLVTTFRFSSTIDPVGVEIQRAVIASKVIHAEGLLAAADASDESSTGTGDPTSSNTSDEPTGSIESSTGTGSEDLAE